MTNITLKHYMSPQYLRAMLPSSGGVGFLFHTTDWDTLSYLFDNIPQRSPSFENELWNTPPFIASPMRVNNEIIGANIVMPAPIDMWISSPSGIRKFREKQFFPALELAKQCNLRMVAMGASTPYVCNYGKLPREASNTYITTGHAATAATLKKWAVHACQETNCDYQNIKLAIFGAAGRLGKAVSQFIAYSDVPKEIILIDLSDKMSLLQTQAQILRTISPRRDLKVSIYCFQDGTTLPEFDGAILVSNNSVPYLDAHDLRQAKFWIDDSHPRAASLEAELESRNDTLYIECYIKGPDGFDRMAPCRLPTTQDCYTCFAEGYVAWREQINHDFVTGIPGVEQIARVDKLLDKYKFNLGPFSGKNGDLITTRPKVAKIISAPQKVIYPQPIIQPYPAMPHIPQYQNLRQYGQPSLR